MKYQVSGTTEVSISIEVEAKDEDEALEKAASKFGGLIQLADGSIGPQRDGTVVTIDDTSDWADWYDVEEIG